MIEWIPITERMPEENVDVLVTIDNGEYEPYVAVSFSSDAMWLFGEYVIAWAELPEPYKP